MIWRPTCQRSRSTSRAKWTIATRSSTTECFTDCRVRTRISATSIWTSNWAHGKASTISWSGSTSRRARASSPIWTKWHPHHPRCSDIHATPSINTHHPSPEYIPTSLAVALFVCLFVVCLFSFFCLFVFSVFVLICKRKRMSLMFVFTLMPFAFLYFSNKNRTHIHTT